MKKKESKQKGQEQSNFLLRKKRKHISFQKTLKRKKNMPFIPENNNVSTQIIVHQNLDKSKNTNEDSEEGTKKFLDKNINKQNSDKNNNLQEDSKENSSISFNTSEEVESLGKIQIRTTKNREKEIVITKKGTSDKIPLIDAKNALDKKDYKSLIEYRFPYLRQSEFNSYIYPITLRVFRKLFFSCPICKKGFRNYSMPYHIFQNHFEQSKKYLNEKEIARCCANLMQKEKEKIEYSFEIFLNLAILFNNCEFRGASQWREAAKDSIKKLKELNFEKKYSEKNYNEVIKNLTKILPLNKNKNLSRKYKKYNF